MNRALTLANESRMQCQQARSSFGGLQLPLSPGFAPSALLEFPQRSLTSPTSVGGASGAQLEQPQPKVSNATSTYSI